MLRITSVFIRRKFRRIFKNFLNKKDIKSLKNKEFVIIANNCWGGEVYQWYKKPYNSPFVGLFLYSPCFIKVVSKFDHYMSKKLKFTKISKYLKEEQNYPIGLIGDAEIHFLHYKTEEEAIEKWNRRKNRMLEVTDKNNYFFKLCDMYNTDENILNEFHKLPYKNKVSFGIKDYASLKDKNHIKINEVDKKTGKHVPNGVKLYKLTFLYFDITNWLKN
ncbi:hypothetical protein Lupro_03985 [Lutibacter profundi]|uniref:Uncharacterized protein n=1 Tax=Lutibacter profundi TaxID=1622118 RepID=A0A109RN83_9FLAO|nr:DUF1919 domain-containing protein [Lutibacter profundi]AMC10462.1 hypothetical protein Lupro_03985 [Lutibacter profundi]